MTRNTFFLLHVVGYGIAGAMLSMLWQLQEYNRMLDGTWGFGHLMLAQEKCFEFSLIGFIIGIVGWKSREKEKEKQKVKDKEK